MKYLNILPLATFAAAFVIPDDEIISQFTIETHRPPRQVTADHSSKVQLEDFFDRAKDTLNIAVENTKSSLDQAIEQFESTVEGTRKTCHQTAFDAKSWIESKAGGLGQKVRDLKELGGLGHHSKPNQTVYELIAKSKYTTKLAALINEYEDLVQLLNGTTANFTVFAPIDKAFEKIPDDVPKPSKEQLKKVLLYHTSKEYYPAGKVLVTHTIPTLYDSEELGGKSQRLSTNIGPKLLTVNFYSRIIAIDIFGTNGVIHGVDSLLIPPPKAADIIQLLPSEFSTLELGLAKTGLFKTINDTSTHTGGTLFAPSNFAFKLLGPKINAFLFSSYGLKYLEALLKYHVVSDQTLYSDAYYKDGSTNVVEEGIPKGYFHVDLPTLLEDKNLSIDVARYGRLINIKINAFSTVTIEDGIASDGVIHVISNVLIPPKKVGGVAQQWQGEELELDDFKERLQVYVDDLEL